MAGRRRIVLYTLLVVGLLALLFLTLPITLTPSVRTRLIAALNERFDSKVDVAELRVSVLPRVRVAGEGVVLRFKGRTDVPPMIAIKSFSAEASLFGLIGGPLHLSRVHLTGLEINIPPGGLKMKSGSGGLASDNGRDEGEINDDADDGAKIDRNKVAVVDIPQPPPPLGPEDEKRPQKPSPLIVDEVISENAELRIIRRTADKPPRVFVIHHLDMNGVGSNDPWAFEATLRNPTPPGDIITRGTFGPWAAGEPSRTPLRGEYNFAQADLGVFKGISGMLASEGKFVGVLERIDVDGRATIPDFTVKTGGHPVKLETTFHAIVDGTNGNTWLDPVHATFGKTTVRGERRRVRDAGRARPHRLARRDDEAGPHRGRAAAGDQGGEAADDGRSDADDEVPAAAGRRRRDAQAQSGWLVPHRAGAVSGRRRAGKDQRVEQPRARRSGRDAGQRRVRSARQLRDEERVDRVPIDHLRRARRAHRARRKLLAASRNARFQRHRAHGRETVADDERLEVDRA